MKLEGIHHITAITADAQRNVDFYAGDAGAAARQEDGQPGQPNRLPPLLRGRGRRPGLRPHLLRVPGGTSGPARRRHGPHGRLATGLGRGARLLARAPEGGRHSRRARRRRRPLRRSRGARARAGRRRRARPAAHRRPSGDPEGDGAAGLPRRARLPHAARREPPAPRRRRSSSRPSTAAGSRAARSAAASTSPTTPPADRGLQGAGSVHHVAWASSPEEHEAWRERAIAGGAQPTPVIDRFYFKSIYFREPGGVLFEIATDRPRLHRRRAARDAWREALAAARLRAPARPGRGEADAGREPAAGRSQA